MVISSNNIEELIEESEPIRRLSRDLLKAAEELSPSEVRYIVDGYYQIQEYRKASNNQARAAQEHGEPALLLAWLAEQADTIEGQIKRAMDHWAQSQRVGRWMMDQKGIGPVLAAGLMAHIDIEKAPTAGHIWRFAGYDPSIKWIGREEARRIFGASSEPMTSEEEQAVDEYELTPAELEALNNTLLSESKPQLTTRQITRISLLTGRRFGNLLRVATNKEGRVTRDSMLQALSKRPWNANLKVLCWKVGDSFVKVSGREGAIYGQAYRQRKEQEVRKNDSLDFKSQADEAVASGRRLTAGQKEYYDKGLLPPGRIDLRARRWAVKLFLSHVQHVMFEDRFGEPPPKPYVISELGHAHYLAPPGWPRD